MNEIELKIEKRAQLRKQKKLATFTSIPTRAVQNTLLLSNHIVGLNQINMRFFIIIARAR